MSLAGCHSVFQLEHHWLGTLHRVTIADRALGPSEIRALYEVGPEP